MFRARTVRSAIRVRFKRYFITHLRSFITEKRIDSLVKIGEAENQKRFSSLAIIIRSNCFENVVVIS